MGVRWNTSRRKPTASTTNCLHTSSERTETARAKLVRTSQFCRSPRSLLVFCSIYQDAFRASVIHWRCHIKFPNVTSCRALRVLSFLRPARSSSPCQFCFFLLALVPTAIMDHAGSDPPRARLVRDYSSESYFDDLSEPPSVVRSPGLSSADSQPQSNSASDGLEYDYRSQEVLTPITEQSYYGHASDFMSQHSAVSHSSSARMADFFGAEIFRIVLHTPTSLHQLTKFAHSRLCGENLDFLEQVCGVHHTDRRWY